MLRALFLAILLASCEPLGDPGDKQKMAKDLKSIDNPCERIKACVKYPPFPVGRICGCCFKCEDAAEGAVYSCGYETCVKYCEVCYRGKCSGC